MRKCVVHALILLTVAFVTPQLFAVEGELTQTIANEYAGASAAYQQAYDKCMGDRHSILSFCNQKPSQSEIDNCMNASWGPRYGAVPKTEADMGAIANRCQAEAKQKAGSAASNEEPGGGKANVKPGVTHALASAPAAKETFPTAAPKTTAPPQNPPSNTPAAQPAQSPAQSQANANAAISQCSQLASRANSCCSNPQSCASAQTNQAIQALNQPPPNTQAGLAEYCRQMNALGASSGSINQALSSACAGPQYNCESTCSSLADQHPSAASQLNSYANSCRSLQARVSALGSQGLNSSNAIGRSSLCQQVTAANPSGFQGGYPNSGAGPNYGGGTGSNEWLYGSNPGAMGENGYGSAGDPYGCGANPNNPACLSCTPGAPGCTKQEEAQQGKAGFAGDDSGGNPNFNIADTNDAQKPERQFQKFDPQGRSNNVVANNSGGGIPGGDDGGGPGAKLDQRGRFMGPPGPGNNPADVHHGLGPGGGYSQQPGGGGPSPGDSGLEGSSGWNQANGGQRQPANEDGRELMGVDLKRFLPGYGNTVGGYISPGREINDRSEVLWNRISMKLFEKCRLGKLLGCGPNSK